MRSFLILHSAITLASAFPYNDLFTRAIIPETQVADSYDFVIVGGGQAGLVLASRLSEDAHTVLVLEAGKSGSEPETNGRINQPLNTYINSTLDLPEYKWDWTTTNQPRAANRMFWFPTGRVLGGNSAINALYYIRPTKTEIDIWARLNSNQSDAEKYWSYDPFLKALKRAETFHAPLDTIRQQANIQYNAESYGSQGPIHVTYPAKTYEAVGLWSRTFENISLPVNRDPASGNTIGAFISNTAINPSNWTRSYARSGYIDPLRPRSNLAIVTQATATRIIWADRDSADGPVASAVEFASSEQAERRTVKVNREVIVTSGPMGTPKFLQLSGIGPREALTNAGIQPKVDLPGVGARLTDHILSAVTYQTNSSTAQSTLNAEGRTPEAMSGVNTAVAYITGSQLLANISALQDYAASIYNESAYGETDPTLLAGYKTLYNLTINQFYQASDVGLMEFVMHTIAEGTVTIQASLQKPLSLGKLTINGSNPFNMPIIDPRFLSHDNDLIILREGLKLARHIARSQPLGGILGEEIAPGGGVMTDEQFDGYLAGTANTQFHQASTSGMLPREHGGVVNPLLKVYGTSNVRVADSSVMPFSLSCHLMSTTYGIAEQAAAIIREAYPEQQAQAQNGVISGPLPYSFAAFWVALTMLFVL